MACPLQIDADPDTVPDPAYPVYCFDADPDMDPYPYFLFDADPDPNADPDADPGYQNDADPDPQHLYLRNRN